MFDLIAQIPLIGPFLSTAIPFILVLGIVVAIHEYGHYIVGKWCGIHAEVFSLGFGPVLFRKLGKDGTVWQLALVPLGGYVKFLGDGNAASQPDSEAVQKLSQTDRDRSMAGAALYKRALTVAAGPVANFILSLVLFMGLMLYQGKYDTKPVIDHIYPAIAASYDLKVGDDIKSIEGLPITEFSQIFAVSNDLPLKQPLSYEVVRDGNYITVNGPYPVPAIVSAVSPLSAAYDAGIKENDWIISANDKPIVGFSQLQDVVKKDPTKSISLGIERNSELVKIDVTPRMQEMQDENGDIITRSLIGISAGVSAFSPAIDSVSIPDAFTSSVGRIKSIITGSVSGLWGVITGKVSPKNLQGPLGIAQISGQVASQGWIGFIGWIAMISTAIGMLNLFPIPILDGGHLMFFAYEAIAGKPPSERAQGIAMTIGLGLMLFLMIFATQNDITRWFFS